MRREAYVYLFLETEIFPLKNLSGIAGSRHSKQINENVDFDEIGEYPVEFVIDRLTIGSLMGPIGILAEDSMR